MMPQTFKHYICDLHNGEVCDLHSGEIHDLHNGEVHFNVISLPQEEKKTIKCQ